MQIQNQKYSLAEALQNLSRRNTDKGREDQVQKNLSVFILSHIFSSVHAPGYSLGFFYIPSEDYDSGENLLLGVKYQSSFIPSVSWQLSVLFDSDVEN